MENKNTYMEKAMELNIESWNRVGWPIPEPVKNWCREHGREDLLGEINAESAFLPSTHELAEMFGVSLPDDFIVESKKREAEIETGIDSLPNMEEIFGKE